ncbi:hypothetical protein MBANPS3_007447 [Mucor bainieri]
MANLNSLPYEVQRLILQHIDSPKQLGEFDHYTSLQEVQHLLKDLGMKLQHLKSIPLPGVMTETHYETILLLKDSLEEIKITTTTNSIDEGPHEISQHLREFKCLSKLHVDCLISNLPQAETIFRGVRNLKEIDLVDCYVDEENNWPSEERLNWMKQKVEINEDAITLKASDRYSLGTYLIEYFLYKYPNIKYFDYQQACWFESEPANAEISTQASLWVSKIPSYDMKLSAQHQWKSHYRAFAGNNRNVFQLNYVIDSFELFEDEGYSNQITSKLEQNQRRNTQFQFSIDNTFEEDFFDTHFAFLEDIGTFTTQLHMNFDNTDHYSMDPLNTMESKVFFKALEVMNRLEDMHLISPKSLVSVELNLSPQYRKRQLNTLKINDTKIQPKAFLTLDSFFHTIKTLTLLCCPIEKDQTNTMCIHLPSTALGKLTMTADLEPTAWYDYQQDLQNLVSFTQDTYLMVNLQQGTTLYFKLEPFNGEVYQVPFVDYFSRPRNAKAFSIYCQLISIIELDLGDISAVIDIQKYCTTLDAAIGALTV